MTPQSKQRPPGRSPHRGRQSGGRQQQHARGNRAPAGRAYNQRRGRSTNRDVVHARPVPIIGKYDELKIIPLGGLEEVGRNMTVFEYKDDIVIVDLGLQFPEEDMPGIDYIIPNIEYLKGKEKNIRGVIITHGHLDHVGAVSHLIPKLGNPPLYATGLSRGIILKRHDDFPNAGKMDITIITTESKITLGAFRVEFFHVNHNIPDSVGVALFTPEGLVMHTGDFKFDHSPIGDKPADLGRIVQLADHGVLALLEDSTNAEEPGHTISERVVQQNLEEIIKRAEGRVIAATFGSLISRIQELINIAEKYGRKVAIDGYSMRTNVEISRELGFIKAQKGTLISIKEVNRHPREKIVIVCTGAQGEGEAVLMRIAHKEHRFVHIEPGDMVIFSSSVVPGNERSVQALKDLLLYQGAKLVHSKLMDVHASGHASEEDLKLMMNLVKPKYLIPVHGSHSMLRVHSDVAQSVGIPAERVLVLANGQAALFKDNVARTSKERAPTNYIMVDGLGIGDVGHIVLRDRQMMAADGIFVIITTIDSKTGRLRGNPDIISRGFVYLREAQDLLRDVRKRVRGIVEGSFAKEHTLNDQYLKDEIRNKIGQFLFSKTERRPMVIPVIIKV